MIIRWNFTCTLNMAASLAWICVTVRKGLIVKQTSKIVKCNWEDSFAELFAKSSDQLEVSTIEKVLIAKSDKFDESIGVPADAPVYLYHQFDSKFVCFILVDDAGCSSGLCTAPGSSMGVGSVAAPPTNHNFMSCELMLPESNERATRGDIAIRNKVLNLLHGMKLGWHADVLDTTGKKFIKALSDTLWTLDPHHKQFIDRGCPIPSLFHDFQGFNDWQSKKQKKPQLNQCALEKHIGLLSDYMMQPWFCSSVW